MNIRLLTIAAGCIFLVAIFFLLRSPAEITNYPSQGSNIIAFGDSLIEGVGATPGNDFVTRLSKEFNVPIINAGHRGDTTAMALKRIENSVLQNNPKVVLLLLGGNDFLHNVPKEETFANLQLMIDKIHAKGAVVVLLGVRGGLLKDIYRESFDDLAKKNHTAYVPNVLEDILGNKSLLYDEVHPNSKGYSLIAEKVAPVLEKVLK